MHCPACGAPEIYDDCLNEVLRLVEGFRANTDAHVDVILGVDANVGFNEQYNPYGGDKIEPRSRLPDELALRHI